MTDWLTATADLAAATAHWMLGLFFGVGAALLAVAGLSLMGILFYGIVVGATRDARRSATYTRRRWAARKQGRGGE